MCRTRHARRGILRDLRDLGVSGHAVPYHGTAQSRGISYTCVQPEVTTVPVFWQSMGTAAAHVPYPRARAPGDWCSLAVVSVWEGLRATQLLMRQGGSTGFVITHAMMSMQARTLAVWVNARPGDPVSSASETPMHPVASDVPHIRTC